MDASDSLSRLFRDSSELEQKQQCQSNQFWQHNNKPIELWSPEVIEQKAEHIHNNPVVSGFVSEAWHWRYSSAIDYSEAKGMLEIDYL
ncbi:MAG TPA: hypothetical protein VNI52_10485 [Sphingobacteriaceae bacterium]|nr:hypothetical protein [Sphingobacteriaceae bacterium]